MTKPVWRLIPPLEASGTVQMAIDRWLFRQHDRGHHPPTLRFYTWKPAAISLGYHQHQYPDFWNRLSWQDRPVEIVRRPTGGRAVLHQGDLTYMVVTSGLTGTRSQTYRAICEFLIRGWRSLGLELHYGNAGRGYIRNVSCFSTATAADLVTTEGYKLIGSAQLCRGSTLLQHGSMRLFGDTALFAEVFQTPPPPPLTRECFSKIAAFPSETREFPENWNSDESTHTSGVWGGRNAPGEGAGGQSKSENLGLNELVENQAKSSNLKSIHLKAPPLSPVRDRGKDFVRAVMAALIQAARTCFEIELVVSPLSETEWQEVRAVSHQPSAFGDSPLEMLRDSSVNQPSQH